MSGKRADRAAARKLWAQVARGDLDHPALREWLAAVAQRLLDADDTPTVDGGNARVLALQRAVGLSGSKGNAADQNRDLLLLQNLARLNPDTFTRMENPTPAEVRAHLRQVVVSHLGLPETELDTRAGRDRVNSRLHAARKPKK